MNNINIKTPSLDNLICTFFYVYQEVEYQIGAPRTIFLHKLISNI